MTNLKVMHFEPSSTKEKINALSCVLGSARMCLASKSSDTSCYGMAPRNEQTSNHRLNIEFLKTN